MRQPKEGLYLNLAKQFLEQNPDLLLYDSSLISRVNEFLANLELTHVDIQENPLAPYDDGADPDFGELNPERVVGEIKRLLAENSNKLLPTRLKQ